MATFYRTKLNQLRYDTVITLLDKYATRIEHNKYEFYNTLETDEIFEEYNEIIVLIYHNKVITNIQKGKYKISNSTNFQLTITLLHYCIPWQQSWHYNQLPPILPILLLLVVVVKNQGKS